jgi:hypothetical protein
LWQVLTSYDNIMMRELSKEEKKKEAERKNKAWGKWGVDA